MSLGPADVDLTVAGLDFLPRSPSTDWPICRTCQLPILPKREQLHVHPHEDMFGTVEMTMTPTGRAIRNVFAWWWRLW